MIILTTIAISTVLSSISLVDMMGISSGNHCLNTLRSNLM